MYEPLIEYLSGTCLSLDEACDTFNLDPMNQELGEVLDERIFCCTDCYWWCEIHEESSEEVGAQEWICAQCAEENY